MDAASAAAFAGRALIAPLFLGGAVQKVLEPGPAQDMIAGIGLPPSLVWLAAAFNLAAGLVLLTGPHIRLWALALAGYCVFTSYFHWQLRADPWQVTIAVKNIATAGGLLVLAAHGPGRWVLWGREA